MRASSFAPRRPVLCYSPKGLNGMSEKFHDLFCNQLYRGRWKDRPRPIVLNTWEAFYFGLDHQRVLELARQGGKGGHRDAGADDGWFGHRNDDTSSLGDWFEIKKSCRVA